MRQVRCDSTGAVLGPRCRARSVQRQVSDTAENCGNAAGAAPTGL